MKKTIHTLTLLLIFSFLHAQEVKIHEDFQYGMERIAIDEDNDVLWIGGDLFTDSSNRIVRRAADGTRTNISELTDQINMQSITAMWMDEDVLFAGGYQGLAIVNTDENEYIHFTPDNSDLSYTNSPNAVVYDYNSEELYYTNPATDIDILSEDGWRIDNTLKQIQTATFDYENDIMYLLKYDELIAIDEYGNKTSYTTDDGMVGLGYVDMCTDSDGNVFMVSRDGGMVVFDGTNFTHYTNSNSDLFGGDIYTIEAEPYAGVWIGVRGALQYFENGNFTFYNLETLTGSFSSVNDLVIDNNHHLWLATSSGLVEFWRSTSSIDNNATKIKATTFPNPFENSFVINSPFSGSMTITNTQGKQELQIPINEGKNSIPFENRLAGIYFYHIENESNTITGKVVNR